MMSPGKEEMKYTIIVVGALETNCYLAGTATRRGNAPSSTRADRRSSFFPRYLRRRPQADDDPQHPRPHRSRRREPRHEGQVRHPGSSSIPRTRRCWARASSNSASSSGAEDSPPADKTFADGDRIKIGNGALRVLHTPGHTPGSVSLLADGFLFSGDTLFFEGVGRTDLPGGSGGSSRNPSGRRS